MIVQVPSLLDAAELVAVRERLAAAEWEDGRRTAGHQSSQVKHNLQLATGSAAARELGELVVRALERSALFISAALPRHVYPPLFNRYEGGMGFGAHVDNAMRQVPGTHHRLRTDLSATLFLSPAQDYDGGELIIEDTFGSQRIRLPAGDLVLYPASSLHRVSPVTRGTRLAAFFWVQSMVREDGERRLLYEMDTAIRQLAASSAHSPGVVQLTACYHNLLRRWAEL
ncbi:MAG TPA: Fe2+-dependent dioxygenase [Steroidobacteraceae bacterium]|jgi:PKHD-type hydroxylase|nr:Fe2+-dependent dioxygenase [Steroidobacteraceae bacterium]